jgi:hypothetical protein
MATTRSGDLDAAASGDSSGTSPEGATAAEADNEERAIGEVKRLDEVLSSWGISAPDEYVGPENSKYVIDYGRPPVLLADSGRVQDRSAHEDALYEEFRELVKRR